MQKKINKHSLHQVVYAGNIQNNQTALRNLSREIPVTAQVVSRNGALQIGLTIRTRHVDALLSADIREPLYTALAGGNIEPENQVANIKNCDTSITGINSLAALTSGEQVVFADGWDATFVQKQRAALPDG